MAYQQCPGCKVVLDVSRNISGKMPVQGDIIICPSCGAVLSFTLSLSVRAFSSEEMRRLEAHDPMAYAYLKGESRRMVQAAKSKGANPKEAKI